MYRNIFRDCLDFYFSGDISSCNNLYSGIKDCVLPCQGSGQLSEWAAHSLMFGYKFNSRYRMIFKKKIKRHDINITDDEFKLLIGANLLDYDACLTANGKRVAIQFLTLREQCAELGVKLLSIDDPGGKERVEEKVAKIYEGNGSIVFRGEGMVFLCIKSIISFLSKDLFFQYAKDLDLDTLHLKKSHYVSEHFVNFLFDMLRKETYEIRPESGILYRMGCADKEKLEKLKFSAIEACIETINKVLNEDFLEEEIETITRSFPAFKYEHLCVIRSLRSLIGENRSIEFFSVIFKENLFMQGWSDLTIIDKDRVRFMEVKGKGDKIHMSQILFIEKVKKYSSDFLSYEIACIT